MDDSVIKSITIGVGVFIAMATITAIMLYYNAAKEGVRNIGTGTNIDENYSREIKNTLLRADGRNNKIYSEDVKNILNYFYEDGTVTINVNNIPLFIDRSDMIIGMSLSGINLDKASTDRVIKSIVPSRQFEIIKINDNEYTINLIS